MALQFYPAVISKEPDTDFGVVFPDFPGCVSAGETVQEAAANAAEALALHVEGLLDAGEAVPAPSAPGGPLPDWLAGVPGETVAHVLVPVEMPGRIARVNVALDEELLARLDAAAASEGTSRSGYIADAVRERLRRPADVR